MGIADFFKNVGRKLADFGKGALGVGRRVIDTVTNIGNKVLPVIASVGSFIPIIGPEIAAAAAGGQGILNAVNKGVDVLDDVVNKRQDIGQAVKEGIGIVQDVAQTGQGIGNSINNIKNNAGQAKKQIQRKLKDIGNSTVPVLKMAPIASI